MTWTKVPMGLYHSGEISDADLELAAKLHREHMKKHGSQMQEERIIDAKHQEAEDKHRDDRRKANLKKAAAHELAAAATLVTEASATNKFYVVECKAQLKAWAAWLTLKDRQQTACKTAEPNESKTMCSE